MKNQNINEDLLRANLQGNATDTEKTELLSWLADSHDNEKLFDKMTKIWASSEQIEVFEQIDLKQDWKNIQIKRKVHNRLIKYWFQYAAVLLVGLGLGFFYLHETTPGFGKLAQIKTEFDKNIIQLSDGSRIQLNTDSRLIYPNKFNSNRRLVKLEGEAFFNVNPDASKVFIIESGEAIIKVLGTSFNVRNISKNQTIVSVNSGRVSLIFGGSDQEIVLTKGQVGQLKNNKLTEVKKTSLNYDSWRTGILKFKETPFVEVLEEIGKLYQVSIKNENIKLDTLKVTTDFTNLELEKVLSQLKLLIQVKIEKKGKMITIK